MMAIETFHKIPIFLRFALLGVTLRRSYVIIYGMDIANHRKIYFWRTYSLGILKIYLCIRIIPAFFRIKPAPSICFQFREHIRRGPIFKVNFYSFQWLINAKSSHCSIPPSSFI